jgi:hypothetical protein
VNEQEVILYKGEPRGMHTRIRLSARHQKTFNTHFYQYLKNSYLIPVVAKIVLLLIKAKKEEESLLQPNPSYLLLLISRR